MSLTPSQISDLDRLEKVIEKTKAHFLECGTALRTIKDNKLYLRDYDSFEAYCEGKWGWGARRARQLIQASDFWESEKLLVATGTKTESQAKESLEQLKKQQRSIKSGNPLPPVMQVGDENKENLLPSKPAVPLDKTGTKIPPPALPFWERREEVQPWLNVISEIKCAIEKALKEGDAMFAWNGNPAIGYLTNAYAAIANSKPYAVCTDCQGWFTKVKAGGCSTCHNTGFLSKHQYDVCSRSEVKAIREKAAAMRQ